MKVSIVAVKDALKGYSTIYVYENDEVAKRDFKRIVNSDDIVKLNLPDFSMYKLGTYDKESGKIETDGCPVLLISASDCRDINV